MKKVWRKFAAVLLAAVLAVGILHLSAATVFAADNYVEITVDSDEGSFSKAPISVSVTNPTEMGAWLTTNGGQPYSITFTADSGCVISKIEATVDTALGSPSLSVTKGSLNNANPTPGDSITISEINADSVTLMNNSTMSDGNVYIITFKVYYTPLTFKDLQALIDATPNEDAVKLEKDYTYDSSVDGERYSTITINKNIILDLNGHTINGKNENNGKSVILVTLGAQMDLEDSSTDKTGTITGGEPGGVYVYQGSTFTMNEGNISDNTDGGVYNTGSFIMYGGTISGNTASADGGGVYTRDAFYVGGNSNITGNKKGEAANNVYLPSDKTITIAEDKPFVSGASIGVSTEEVPTEDSPVIVSGTITADCSSYFSSDNKDYSVNFNTDHLELALVPPTGDSSNMIVWLSILGVAAAGMIIAILRRKAQ